MVLDTGSTVTNMVTDRYRYNRPIIKNRRRATINRCLWKTTTSMATVVDIMMRYSDTARPQSRAATLSSIMSLSGGVVFLSGSRSCTKDSDIIFTQTHKNRKKNDIIVFHISLGYLSSLTAPGGISTMKSPACVRCGE